MSSEWQFGEQKRIFLANAATIVTEAGDLSHRSHRRGDRKARSAIPYRRSRARYIYDQTERKRLEERLKRSEKRFRQLFQFSPIPYLITLPEGPIVDVNDAWVRMSGYSREEAIGRSTIELGMMLDPEQRDQLVKDVLQKRRLSNVEIKRRTKSGEIRSLLNSLEVVELGGQTCILNMQVDITERKKMEDSLQRSEEILRSFIDAIPYYAYIIDTNGTFILANQWTAKRFRKSADQLVGSCIFNLLSSDVVKDRKALISQAIRSGKSVSVERTSREEIIDYHVYPILDVEGNVTRLAILGVDITGYRKLEEELKRHSEDLEMLISKRTRELTESEEKYRGIYEASLSAIYTTSVDGTIVDMNPAGVSMFGFDTLDEMRKVNVIDLYADPSDRKKLIELVRQGPVKGHEIRLKRKDGRVFDAFLNAYALRDEEGKIIGLQGAIMDMTERRELERMRDQLTSTILLDVTRRRELEKIRDQFISVVTHELRTPLTSIKGYVDDVLTGEVGEMSEQVASSLLVVKRNADRLLDLVNELLEIRRLESGRFQLDLTLFDFREIVNHCAQEIKPLIDEKGQILRIENPERPVTIRGDRTRLIQVFMNLLNNANKFTPEGGNIVLRVEERGESVRIRVSDTGIGIRKEDLERVFEPFAAIEKPTYVKGTGLGLSVTKGLVEAHRGKIWAESLGEGKGTTFIVVLPKEEAVKSD